MSEHGSPTTKRFVRSAWTLLAFQFAAAAGAAGVTIWAATEVRGLITQRDLLAARVETLEKARPSGRRAVETEPQSPQVFEPAPEPEPAIEPTQGRRADPRGRRPTGAIPPGRRTASPSRQQRCRGLRPTGDRPHPAQTGVTSSRSSRRRDTPAQAEGKHRRPRVLGILGNRRRREQPARDPPTTRPPAGQTPNTTINRPQSTRPPTTTRSPTTTRPRPTPPPTNDPR